jgi:pimeloyl-ACP methyl ester carboxylesterase
VAAIGDKSPSMRWQLIVVCMAVACGDDATVVDSDETGSTGEVSTTMLATSTSASTSSTGPEPTSTTTVDPTGDSSSTGEPPPPALEWIEDCTIGRADLGVLHPMLQCTSIEVPLDWDDPEGEQIVVAALRVPTTAQPRRGQMWMLDGGPGGSGLGFFNDTALVDAITGAGWDYVVPSHRGTLSPALDCDFLDPLSPECRDRVQDDWGDGVRHFNTRWAARDVGEFIARTEAELDESTIVYGVSYGTYWAQFYVGEHPDQADGVILDSVVPTDGDLAAEEFIVQQRAEALLQACVDDPICGPRVGFTSGAEFSAAVIAAIDDGDCGGSDFGLWEDASYRYEFGQLMNSHRVRNYIPLLAAMLTRCDPELTQLVETSVNQLFAAAFADRRPIDALPLGVPFELFSSQILQALVMGTTMLLPDAQPQTAVDAARNHFASLGFGDWANNTNAVWGDLPDVEFDRDFVTETPLLIFNSTYDLQTVFPWAQQVAEHQMQPLHEFADGQHALAFSGTGGKFPDGSPCARKLMLDFSADPTASLDASCVNELPAIDPNLARADLQEISTIVFSTDDPWTLLPPEQ